MYQNHRIAFASAITNTSATSSRLPTRQRASETPLVGMVLGAYWRLIEILQSLTHRIVDHSLETALRPSGLGLISREHVPPPASVHHLYYDPRYFKPQALLKSKKGPDVSEAIHQISSGFPASSITASGFHPETTKRSWPRIPGVVVLLNGTDISIFPPLIVFGSISLLAGLNP